MFSQENVTLLIAIAGFLLSLFTIARQLWKERKHLAVSFNIENPWNTSIPCKFGQDFIIAVLFENKSLNPIAITRVTFCGSNFSCACVTNPRFVGHQFHSLCGTSTHFFERFLESAQFPIELTGLGAAEAFLYFSTIGRVNWQDLNKIIVSTNRGKIILRSETHLQALRGWLQESCLSPAETPVHSEEHQAVLI